MDNEFKSISPPFDISTDSYGGNQGDFKTKRNINTGCGPIALMNMYAYYKGEKLDKEKLIELEESVLSYLKGPVIAPFQFIMGAKKLFREEGMEIKHDTVISFSINSMSFIRLQNFIKKYIDLGHPLAMLVGPINPFKKEQNLELHDFRNHWVLITEYNFKEDEKLVSVSSWGEKYILNLTDLLSIRLFLSVTSIVPFREIS